MTQPNIPRTRRAPLLVFPLTAPVQQAAFDLVETFFASLSAEGETLQAGDVVAISSKYAAISEGRVIRLDELVVSEAGAALAARYHMNPSIAQLVLQEADHIFGGIHGFLLTSKDGILSPNAGIDRSNIPTGYAVLFPADPYATAARLRAIMSERAGGVPLGLILTDSWLMPGRAGTTGVALATAGFKPVQDERGKADLFGNPMQVTQRGIADTICAAAELVMGERDEATPFVIVRNAPITLTDDGVTMADVAFPREHDIYVESLTEGALDPSLLAFPALNKP